MTQPKDPQFRFSKSKFLEYPMVIDWLQWSDEFKQELGKPDMPQITLTLIADMRSEIKAIQSKLAEAEAEIKELNKYKWMYEELCK